MADQDTASSADAAHVPPHALLLDNDLFFVTKIIDTLKHTGWATTTARRLEDFLRRLGEDRPELALVNTAVRGVDWQTAIRAAREAGVPVIAFGSHVDLETQAAARQAGASRVISNSKLAADLPGIVARTVRRPGHETPDADASDAAEAENDE
jgi:DNA-binding response OmpR family regulator